MAIVKGVVEGVSEKFGKYSVNVNGIWYGTKQEWATVRANKGDEVEFDDGGSKFLKRLKIVSAGRDSASPSSSAPKSNSSGGGGWKRGTFPLEADDHARSICRQNALTNACNTLRDILLIDDNDDEHAERIINLAKKFEYYTTGDEDFDAAKEALEEAKTALGE